MGAQTIDSCTLFDHDFQGIEVGVPSGSDRAGNSLVGELFRFATFVIGRCHLIGVGDSERDPSSLDNVQLDS